MELSVNGRQRRTAQAAAPAFQAGKRTPAGGSAVGKPRTDRTAWSQQALAFLQEVNRRDMEDRREQAKQREEGDVLSESLKIMERCQKIAARIMRGDKVPPQDEQYLMERDPNGYKLALVCREPKEDPKEWESVLKEDEQSESAESADAASAGEPAESGGEAAEC